MIRSSKIAEDALPLIEIGLPPNSSHATDAPRTTWRWSMRVENDSFRRFVGDMVYAITRGIARTQYSFSTDPQLRDAPEGHVFNVRDVYLNAGAGFMVVLSGEIMTMPGCRKCRRRTTSTSTPTATSTPA